MTALADSFDDLDDLLSGPEPDYETDPTPPGDLDEVNRWLRRIARLDRADADDEAVAEAEIARVNLWLAARRETRARQREWFTHALEAYHRAVLDRDPRAKTIDLPAGKLISRAQQPDWDYRDEAAFITWAAECRPDLLRRPTPPPPTPDKVAVKKAATPVFEAEGFAGEGFAVIEGEVIPGVVVVARGPKFTVETDGTS